MEIAVREKHLPVTAYGLRWVPTEALGPSKLPDSPVVYVLHEDAKHCPVLDAYPRPLLHEGYHEAAQPV